MLACAEAIGIEEYAVIIESFPNGETKIFGYVSMYSGLWFGIVAGYGIGCGMSILARVYFAILLRGICCFSESFRGRLHVGILLRNK